MTGSGPQIVWRAGDRKAPLLTRVREGWAELRWHYVRAATVALTGTDPQKKGPKA